VIVDFHSDPFYGDPDTPNIVGGPSKASTSHFYSYLTADLWAPKGLQTIAVHHRTPRRGIAEHFGDILARIELFLQPKLFLLDGEFRVVDLLNVLQEKGYPFIVRTGGTPNVKPFQDEYENRNCSEPWMPDTPVTLVGAGGKSTYTGQLIFYKLHGKTKALLVPLGFQLTAEESIQWYEKRFSSETGFRDKHRWQARTCSTSLSFRLVLIVFAVILWNLWQAFLILVHWRRSSRIPASACHRRRLKPIKRRLFLVELLTPSLTLSRR